MNRYQAIALTLAVLNLILVALFPPYDYLSPARHNVPTFDGFYFALDDPGGRLLNSSFLQLEMFVILVNAAVAWILLKERGAAGSSSRIDWQKIVLFGTGLNLLLVLLFPPMENYYAVTRSALPSFDGFYFLFSDHEKRSIVTAILYIEVIIVLVNGALLYLLFRKTGAAEISEAERARMIAALKQAGGSGAG